MTDAGKLHQQQDRGQRAKRILDDELVKEALDKIEAGILEAFKSSAIGDDTARRHAREAHGILQNFRDQLGQVMATGEFAMKELLRGAEESKLKKVLHGRR